MEVYQESLGKGELPPTMQTGLVTLLYKKGKKEDLANWRPITLLTTDYKVLAKVITVMQFNMALLFQLRELFIKYSILLD